MTTTNGKRRVVGFADESSSIGQTDEGAHHSQAPTTTTTAFKARKFQSESTVPSSFKERQRLERILGKRGEAVGLKNRGATCYLNALLQTMFFTPELREQVLSWAYPAETYTRSAAVLHYAPFDGDTTAAATTETSTTASQKNTTTDADKTKYDICYQLHVLFAFMCASERAFVDPRPLLESFGWSSEDIGVQHDVNEMNRVLFDAIQETSGSQEEGSATTPATATKGFIDRLYAGSCREAIRCTSCGFTRGPTSNFYELFVGIRDKTNIADALRGEIEKESIEGVSCDGCNAQTTVEKGNVFTDVPQILTIYLRRLDYNLQSGRREKLPHDVALAPQLDVDSLLCASADDSQQRRNPAASNLHHLQCFIVHSGTAYHGHYFAFVRDADGRWLRCDDDEVTVAEAATVEYYLDPASVKAREQQNASGNTSQANAAESTSQQAQAASQTTEVAEGMPEVNSASSDWLFSGLDGMVGGDASAVGCAASATKQYPHGEIFCAIYRRGGDPTSGGRHNGVSVGCHCASSSTPQHSDYPLVVPDSLRHVLQRQDEIIREKRHRLTELQQILYVGLSFPDGNNRETNERPFWWVELQANSGATIASLTAHARTLVNTDCGGMLEPGNHVDNTVIAAAKTGGSSSSSLSSTTSLRLRHYVDFVGKGLSFHPDTPLTQSTIVSMNGHELPQQEPQEPPANGSGAAATKEITQFMRTVAGEDLRYIPLAVDWCFTPWRPALLMQQPVPEGDTDLELFVQVHVEEQLTDGNETDGLICFKPGPCVFLPTSTRREEARMGTLLPATTVADLFHLLAVRVYGATREAHAADIAKHRLGVVVKKGYSTTALPYSDTQTLQDVVISEAGTTLFDGCDALYVELHPTVEPSSSSSAAPGDSVGTGQAAPIAAEAINLAKTQARPLQEYRSFKYINDQYLVRVGIKNVQLELLSRTPHATTTTSEVAHEVRNGETTNGLSGEGQKNEECAIVSAPTVDSNGRFQFDGRRQVHELRAYIVACSQRIDALSGHSTAPPPPIDDYMLLFEGGQQVPLDRNIKTVSCGQPLDVLLVRGRNLAAHEFRASFYAPADDVSSPHFSWFSPVRLVSEHIVLSKDMTIAELKALAVRTLSGCPDIVKAYTESLLRRVGDVDEAADVTPFPDVRLRVMPPLKKCCLGEPLMEDRASIGEAIGPAAFRTGEPLRLVFQPVRAGTDPIVSGPTRRVVTYVAKWACDVVQGEGELYTSRSEIVFAKAMTAIDVLNLIAGIAGIPPEHVEIARCRPHQLKRHSTIAALRWDYCRDEQFKDRPFTGHPHNSETADVVLWRDTREALPARTRIRRATGGDDAAEGGSKRTRGNGGGTAAKPATERGIVFHSRVSGFGNTNGSEESTPVEESPADASSQREAVPSNHVDDNEIGNERSSDSVAQNHNLALNVDGEGTTTTGPLSSDFTPPAQEYSTELYASLETTCPICFTEFEDGDGVCVIDPCYHLFHRDCLAPWTATHSTCPSCKAIIRLD